MNKPFAHAQSRLQAPIAFDALLATLTVKDRARVEKQISDYEAAGSDALATLWKRLMCSLSTLAPHRTKINSPQSIQYYEQDGKNRRQVFALEDSGKPAAGASKDFDLGAPAAPAERTVVVYCEDILDQVIKAGLLRREAKRNGVYTLSDGGELAIDRIDGSVINPPEFFKHMVGWNRRALCIRLPVSATEAQIAAAELLCAISLGEAK